MRLWIFLSLVFGSVVMIVKVLSTSSGNCELRQVSHKPAKANGSLFFNRINIGNLWLP